eukprot:6257464-Pyramimonas_sp.AAC.1
MRSVTAEVAPNVAVSCVCCKLTTRQAAAPPTVPTASPGRRELFPLRHSVGQSLRCSRTVDP